MDDLLRFSQSSGPAAGAPDRGRSTYPRAAVEWMVGTDQRSVLEVGAGTGQLTDELLALGHDVYATDPSAELLESLAKRLPDVRTAAATAERLPALDASVDVVICAQSFGSFDQEATLGEFARVLRPGGHVALLWNAKDVKIPWVKKLGRIIGDDDQDIQAPESLVRSTRFGFVDEFAHRHWQSVFQDTLCGLALARPEVASLEPTARERKLDEVRALYDDYMRGPDGMQLPWVTKCFKASVIDNPWSVPRREGAEDDRPPEDPDDGDTDSLLIDFR